MMLNLEQLTVARLTKVVRDIAVGMGGGKGDDISPLDFLPFPDLMKPKSGESGDHLKALFSRLVADQKLPLHVATAIGTELGVT